MAHHFKQLHLKWQSDPTLPPHAGILVLRHADPHDLAFDLLTFARLGLPTRNMLYHKAADGSWVPYGR